MDCNRTIVLRCCILFTSKLNEFQLPFRALVLYIAVVRIQSPVHWSNSIHFIFWTPQAMHFVPQTCRHVFVAPVVTAECRFPTLNLTNERRLKTANFGYGCRWRTSGDRKGKADRDVDGLIAHIRPSTDRCQREEPKHLWLTASEIVWQPNREKPDSRNTNTWSAIPQRWETNSSVHSYTHTHTHLIHCNWSWCFSNATIVIIMLLGHSWTPTIEKTLRWDDAR